MIFHTCWSFLDDPDKEVRRQDWDTVDPITEASAKLYKKRLPMKGLDAISESSFFHGRVNYQTPFGAAICHLNMPGIVGLACLFLTGKVPLMEQRFCLRYQKGISNLQGNPRLLLTPLEIDVRPLFYYTVFNLDIDGSDGDLWKSALPETLLWAHGVGLNFLQQYRGGVSCLQS